MDRPLKLLEDLSKSGIRILKHSQPLIYVKLEIVFKIDGSFRYQPTKKCNRV